MNFQLPANIIYRLQMAIIKGLIWFAMNVIVYKMMDI